MTDRYVYLYRITLSKEGEDPLYYFGIRVCKCLPENDSYMGSPKAYKDMWKDNAYTKTKEILKIGSYDKDYDSFRDEEPILIKESWNEYGVYVEGGRSLNARAGKIVHKSFMMGDRNPSKRKDVREKLSLMKKEEYKNKTPPYLTPESKLKSQKAIQKYYDERGMSRAYHLTKYVRENPDKNPTKNNPEMAKYLSEINKERLKDPKERKRISDNAKKMWKRWKEHPEENPHITEEAAAKRREVAARPEVKEKQSMARKKWWSEIGINEETRKKLSKAGKARFARGEPNPMSNPEIHAKAWATRRKNMEEKKRNQQNNSLENYFD